MDTQPASVPLSVETIRRMQRHAEPLIDTYDSIINKAFDALEQLHGARADPATKEIIRAFNAAAPPNLSHTTLKHAEVRSRVLKPNETYWNSLLFAMIREAAKANLPPKELKDLINANSTLGRKEDNGYRYLSDLDISVQGQDSNGAWRAIHHIANVMRIPMKVEFTWQNNANAAFPNTSGSMAVTV